MDFWWDSLNKFIGKIWFVVFCLFIYLVGLEVMFLLGVLNWVVREVIVLEGDLKVIGEEFVEVC